MTKLCRDCPYIEETRAHLKEFANSGLRTLCCAYRILDEEFYNEWAQRFHQATCEVVNRDECVLKVADEVDSDLLLLGATAIEDKLQVGVPATIAAMLKAKISVWIITGDKRETAINIGFACSLLSSEMKLLVLDEGTKDETMALVDEHAEKSDENLALIVSGKTLTWLLDEAYVDRFYELSKKCQSVICYRVSPLQKAAIVSVMRAKTQKLALAIGDGANDVGMILQADVGVGVSGKEGRQAVLAADYAIAQFRYLRRLLLVHGRLNFYRNVDLINYSFYKNMACSLSNVIVGFFSSWSGSTVFDSILYMTYNVIYTSVPPVIYAALERDVSLAAKMD
jgi:phospholipid-translocating P-type ATPase (flippase)